jgi:hypothetical protein
MPVTGLEVLPCVLVLDSSWSSGTTATCLSASELTSCVLTRSTSEYNIESVYLEPQRFLGTPLLQASGAEHLERSYRRLLRHAFDEQNARPTNTPAKQTSKRDDHTVHPTRRCPESSANMSRPPQFLARCHAPEMHDIPT